MTYAPASGPLASYRGLLPLTKSDTQELSTLDAKMFAAIAIMYSRNTPTLGECCQELTQKGMAHAVLSSRLNGCGIEPDPAVFAIVGSWCKEPGHAVLWAFTIAQQLATTGAFDLEALTGALPWGKPAQRLYDQRWQAQKFDSANLLDSMQYWPHAVTGREGL